MKQKQHGYTNDRTQLKQLLKLPPNAGKKGYSGLIVLQIRIEKKRFSTSKTRARLENKVALVTGAGGRLGVAICKAFEKEGATIIAVDKNEQRLKSLKNKMDIHTITADCSDEKVVSQYMSVVFGQYSKIDILVNGTRMKGEAKSFHKTNVNELNQIIESNLHSSIFNCKHVIPFMVQQRQGSIVNIGSFLSGKMVFNGLSNYVIAKHGIIGLTNSIASEYAKDGIRCNTITPGPTIDTRIFDGMAQYCSEILGMPKEEIIKLAANNAMGSGSDRRFADVSEIAQAVLFLASDESSFINSANIDVDGGLRYRSTA